MPFEILIGGGALAFILIIVGAIITMTSDEALVEKRLGRYLDEDLKKAKEAPAEKSSPVGDWLNARMEHSKWGENLSRELARADLKLRPAEYVALMLIMAVGVGAVGWFAGGKSVIFGLLSAVIGLFMPRLMVKSSQAKRLKNFDEQLADMLNLMVNGLRAGYSTMQAMEAVSREMPPPICDEFRRVVQEMQLGIPMETALDNLLRRIPSDDLDLVITAINVQREVGGNLAEILDTITYTIRERVRIKGEIRVLTAQVMYSGRFLSLMPVFIFLILWVLNRQYMMEFFNPETRIPGMIALGIGVLMIGTGSVVMNKIASIEV
ncbi:MAG: secretion system protein [Chloroflexi bacterium]|jgi:tight adherence protein B|nr:secretion system protein [Chloroflexota bacterium]